MKKIKFLRMAIFAALFSLVLISCKTVEMGIQNVQLGMTRTEVINRIGSDFQVASMVQTDQGDVEVLRYTAYTAKGGNSVPTSYYFLHFLNGKLVELHNEPIQPSHYPSRPNRPHR